MDETERRELLRQQLQELLAQLVGLLREGMASTEGLGLAQRTQLELAAGFIDRLLPQIRRSLESAPPAVLDRLCRQIYESLRPIYAPPAAVTGRAEDADRDSRERSNADRGPDGHGEDDVDAGAVRGPGGRAPDRDRSEG